MRRYLQNLVIDAAALLGMVGMVATGLIVRYVLPPSSGRQGLALWGWDRHDWGDLHFALSITVVATVGLHLALHWNWACAAVAHRVLGRAAGSPPISIRRRSAIGIGFLAALAVAVGAFLGIAFESATSSGAGESRGRGMPVRIERHASEFWTQH